MESKAFKVETGVSYDLKIAGYAPPEGAKLSLWLDLERADVALSIRVAAIKDGNTLWAQNIDLPTGNALREAELQAAADELYPAASA